MAFVKDDRKSKHTPRGFVVATDSFMSGWGKAKGGRSFYAIAVDTEDEGYTVMANMKHRSDFKRVHWVRTLKQIRLGPHDHMSIADRGRAPRYFEPGAFAPSADDRDRRRSRPARRRTKSYR